MANPYYNPYATQYYYQAAQPGPPRTSTFNNFIPAPPAVPMYNGYYGMPPPVGQSYPVQNHVYAPQQPQKASTPYLPPPPPQRPKSKPFVLGPPVKAPKNNQISLLGLTDCQDGKLALKGNIEHRTGSRQPIVVQLDHPAVKKTLKQLLKKRASSHFLMWAKVIYPTLDDVSLVGELNWTADKLPYSVTFLETSDPKADPHLLPKSKTTPVTWLVKYWDVNMGMEASDSAGQIHRGFRHHGTSSHTGPSVDSTQRAKCFMRIVRCNDCFTLPLMPARMAKRSLHECYTYRQYPSTGSQIRSALFDL